MTQTTFRETVVLEGSEDVRQLRVQGYTTQTQPLQTWEDQAGAIFVQVTGDGDLRAIQLELAVLPATPSDNPPNGFIKVYPRISQGYLRLYAKDTSGIEYNLSRDSAVVLQPTNITTALVPTGYQSIFAEELVVSTELTVDGAVYVIQ